MYLPYTLSHQVSIVCTSLNQENKSRKRKISGKGNKGTNTEGKSKEYPGWSEEKLWELYNRQRRSSVQIGANQRFKEKMSQEDEIDKSIGWI